MSLRIPDIDDPKISQKSMFLGYFLHVREPCQKLNHVYQVSLRGRAHITNRQMIEALPIFRDIGKNLCSEFPFAL